jgi:hypothetical protein
VNKRTPFTFITNSNSTIIYRYDGWIGVGEINVICDKL